MQVVGFTITFAAFQFGTELLPPSLFRNHPGPQLEWWLVADVLLVVAAEFGDPIAELVLVKADYPLLHRAIMLCD